MAAPVSAPRVGLSPETHLSIIRSRSCYAALRVVISIAFGLGLLLDAIFLLLCLKVWSDPNNPRVMLGGIGIAVLSLMLLVAARQSLLLLIDLVDSTIAFHAREATRH